MEHVWRAPLVPLALAVTAGVVADRYLTVPLLASLSLTGAGLLAWWCTHKARQSGLALVYLGLAAAGLGAGYHHWYLHVYPDDDIGHFTTPEPQLVRVRGVLDEEPIIWKRERNNPLESFPSPDPTLAVLRVTSLCLDDNWRLVSGCVQLFITGSLSARHIDDEVEIVGWLEKPPASANPGEADFATQPRDQRIRAALRVRPSQDSAEKTEKQWRPHSIRGGLVAIRNWCQRELSNSIPDHKELASALILGSKSSLTRAGWQKYMRTGVIHVLVVSGQHLVILASFCWWLLMFACVRRRRGALLVAGFLLGYTFLVGGQPSVMRAAVVVCAGCTGVLLRRPVLVANSFALAWLVVIGLNPTDPFTPGCQLSFLATALLYWGASRLERVKDPLDRLVEECRPIWQQYLFGLGRSLGLAYLVNLAIWLAITPLVAAHFRMIPLVALVIGPPVVLLTSLALILGFLVLLCAVVCWPLAPLLGKLTDWCLAGCDSLVQATDQLTVFHWYVGEIPSWWLWGFYGALLAGLTLRSVQVRWRWLVLAGAAWLCVGLIGGSARPHTEELRCTFLSVGHGGCTVLETPDGRTLLYDAGAMGGPEVTRRHIAPFLWHRGIRRIDELFLSHADLDHFNGVPELLERFAVGHVTWTPSFQHRNTPGVRAILEALEQRRIPARAVCAGDQLRAGETTLNVLHPPLHGPEGNENARSLVLLVQHAGHRILLTGDLEGPGLQRVLSLPPEPVDVLMAPHHGSRAANTSELAAWAQPRVVVSSQGVRHNLKALAAPYTLRGALFYDTAQHGAVTIRSSRSGVSLETFRSRQRIQVLPDALR